VPYRTPAPIPSVPPVCPPKDTLDYVHIVLDRFPVGSAVLAAVLQITFAVGIGVLLAIAV
jgi:hypothetical protein